MRITKLGHCCLLIEEQGLVILTDPGLFTVEEVKKLGKIDVVLITHEHPDHLHTESVELLAQKNPAMRIVTNTAVAGLLAGKVSAPDIVEHEQHITISGVLMEAFGNTHAEIYHDFGLVQNTGYFIANKLFYPGDAFIDPGKPIEILALPVSGPWMKSKDCVEYGLQLKPATCFPVHDGIISYLVPYHKIPEKFLGEVGIGFEVLELGKAYEF